MPATLAVAYAQSAWRIRAGWQGGAASTVASDYVVTRADGGPCLITANSVFVVDSAASTVDLALSERMLSGVSYVVTVGGVSFTVPYRDPKTDPRLTGPVAFDPEAVIFGRDIDWLFGDLTPDGDTEEIVGQRCLVEDAVSVFYLNKNELVQYPEDGVGAPRRTNGDGSSRSVKNLAAAAAAQWRKDDRVVDADAIVTFASDGSVEIGGKIKNVSGGTNNLDE
jgi:hypothetical protein